MSETCQSLLDCKQLFVEYFHRGADIYAAWRSVLTLPSEPLPVRTEILESFSVFQAQIAIQNQLQCFSHNETRQSNTHRPIWADGCIVPRFCG